MLNISPERVRAADIQKMILWEELSFDPADRRCPYSGVQISAAMLLSEQVEIEHILPFSETLDDSLNNKTVSLRQANRIKGNHTPWQAKDDFAALGWAYAAMLERAEQMPKAKRYRFGEDGLQRWLKDDAGFLARALNDTRHLSKVAREYLSLVCPQNTRVIPGRMTAMLRGKFGLNDVLSLQGEKNRNDHRHHAVDACVIAVTDQGLLQRFAKASASARAQQLNRLVENMPLPWPTYREHVARAVDNIWVSHKPDHGHEGAMHNDTAYGLLGNGRVSVHKVVEGKRERIEDNLKVIEFSNAKAIARHGVLPTGEPRPYKGYKGDSNYCIEIVHNDKGKWEGEVIST
ncbi:MAG: type II CRISPR RNA-guided endonuclease Cas9, partial [Burkholderiaceae bacterium]